MTMGMHRALLASILSSLLGLSACSVPNACDPGFEAEHGVCTAVVAPMPDAGGDGDSDGDGDDDAGTEPGTEPDAATEPEPMDQFICPAGGDRTVYGRECTTNDDCECPVSICLPAPLGYCSGTQCLEPGKECPDDLSCIDIGPFRESASIPVPDEVTHVCL